MRDSIIPDTHKKTANRNMIDTVKNMPISRLLEWGLFGIVTTMLAPLVAIAFYWVVVQPYMLGYSRPIDIYNIQYEPQIVQVGDELEMRRVFCLNHVIPAQFRREFRNGIVIPLSETSTSFSGFERGDCSDVYVSVEVPQSLDEVGLHHYQATMIFRVNPLYTTEINLQPIHFYAVETTESKETGLTLTLEDVASEYGVAPDEDYSIYPPNVRMSALMIDNSIELVRRRQYNVPRSELQSILRNPSRAEFYDSFMTNTEDNIGRPLTEEEEEALMRATGEIPED